MKAVFKTNPAKSGFITGTIAPAQRSREPRFGVVDGVIMVALIVGMAAIVRLVLAN